MANLKFLQTQSFTLQASGASVGDTSITVQSFKQIDGVTNIVTADLGDRCYATLEPANGTQEEAIQFTGVTQNANGTATLTGVSSVGFTSPYTVTSGLTKSHAGGVTLILSNDAAFYGNIVTYINNTAASGAAVASDVTSGLTKLTFNQGSNPRARGTLVSQHLTGDMTMLVNSFAYQNGSTAITFTGKTLAYINGASSSTFVAPVSNPRYDLIVYRPSLTDCTSITGTEAASPSLPTPTVGDIILASIYHRVGETKILDRDDSANGYIVSWYEPTPYTTATVLNNQQTTFGTDQSQTTTNATYAVGEANATTKHSIIAQSFVPTTTGIQGVKLWKIADTGSFTGSVKVSLQASTSGSPSGSDLASYTISNAVWLKLNAAAEFAVSFSTEYESMVVGNTYWIVVTPSTSDNANHPNLGYDNTSAHSLVLKYNNSTDGWVATATACLYFKETTGVLSKVVQTDSTSGLIPVNTRPYSFVTMGTTPVSVANTNETSFFTTQLEGGFFTSNSGVRVRFNSSFRNDSGGATVTWRVKYNGSTFLSWTQGTSSGAANPTVYSDVYVLNQGSLSSQKSVAFNFLLTALTTTTNADLSINGTSSIDLSQPGILEITGQIATFSGSNAVTFNQAVVEKIG